MKSKREQIQVRYQRACEAANDWMSRAIEAEMQRHQKSLRRIRESRHRKLERARDAYRDAESKECEKGAKNE